MTGVLRSTDAPGDAPGEWRNWSGSLRFTPARVETPASEADLAALVRRAADEGRTVRVVGAGHSSTPLVHTRDALVSLGRLCGVVDHDAATCEATVRGGTTIKDAGQALLARGLAMPNTGDVDVQTVAGAVATGTHGTGRRLANLATMLVGGRLVSAAGEIVAFSVDRDPELVRALRVSLGALGILTELRLKLEPAFRLERREWCARTDDCLAHLDALVAENRNFDFYWYPRRDDVKLRTLNPPGEGPERLPYATCVEESTGWSADIIPQTRELRFEEMEYEVPAEAGPACFQAVRERVKARHRREVGWRVLYRTIAADDAFLSPAYGRATVAISLHHNAGLPYWTYFRDVEPIFRDHGGRPHWAKKHTLGAADLRPLYPAWDDFQAIRRRMDPDGVFRNAHLAALLGCP